MRNRLRTAARVLAAAMLAVGLAGAGGPATAHHGWSWADGEQVRVEGTIETVSMDPPHPMLRVRDGQGMVWLVELGNPGRTARSGFTAETGPAGTPVTVIGNRDQDHSRARMKAVRLVIDGVAYDMYPERLRAD